MSAIEKFFNTKQIRLILRKDTPWFIAQDVFNALDIKWKQAESLATVSSTMYSQITQDDVDCIDPGVRGVASFQVGTYLLIEAGIYKVAFRSYKPEAGIFTRLLDKMSRIASYLKQGKLEVINESVIDTLIDAANYCILLAAYLQSKNK